MHTVIVATTNQGKLREISGILSDFSLSLVSLRDRFDPALSIPETGDTFEANALLKARWVFARSGEWALADDSGLEVDSLGGAPGVFSARYAGGRATDAENVAKLLGVLEGVPPPERTARFRCTMAFVAGENEVCVSHGVCDGHIEPAPRGENGFGYDPVFVPTGFSHTFAELDPHVKHAVSHRGKALLNLRKELLNRYGKELTL